MSRISKADEATSWRRTIPVSSNDSHSHSHHSTPSSNSKHSYARPATAGSSSVYSRMHQQPAAPMQPLQLLPPRQGIPTEFNVVEAQALLEQRWAALCQQGFKPTCQCQEQQAATNSTDGQEHEGKGDSTFLQELKSAADLKELKAAAEAKLAPATNSADAAWDDP